MKIEGYYSCFKGKENSLLKVLNTKSGMYKSLNILVDDEDYVELSQYKWHVCKYGTSLFYAYRHLNLGNGKRTPILMHRQLLNVPEGMYCDHINGNGLDNRRINLRAVTNRQNMQNIHNLKKTSKYPGVCWEKQSKKWSSSIRVNGKCKRLGRFVNEEDAYRAYIKALEDINETIIEYVNV